MRKDIATFALLLMGCYSADNAGAASPSALPHKDDDYAQARVQLLQAGWKPIPAQCGDGYICFKEFPELATRLSDGVNSGLFSSGKSKIRINTRPILDGQLVESVQYVR